MARGMLSSRLRSCMAARPWKAHRLLSTRGGDALDDAAAGGPLPGLQQRVPGRGWRTITLQPLAAAGLAFRDERPERPQALEWVRRSLLPRGYPKSVTDNYLAYVCWTSVGLLSGRIQSVLATQAALFAVGLGAGAIPMAAAVQWVLKDGIGHACAILYSTAINTRFDADAKRYRFQSTVANTLADFIAIAMPLYPGHFLVLASISSATSSMATVAQLAARARIQASFALRGNLADCARAGQTQAKLMGLVGTGVGAGLSWVVGPNPFAVGVFMVPLALVSLYSMYVSSRMVVLSSLNLQRTERVFRHVLQRMELDAEMPASEGKASMAVPTPRDIAEEETFVFGRPPELFGRGLALQPLIGRVPRSASLPFQAEQVGPSAALPLLGAPAGAWAAGAWAAAWHADGSYALAVRAARPGKPAPPVVLWHRSGSPARVKLQAVWHACLLRHCLSVAEPACLEVQLEELHALALSAWPTILQGLEESGWEVDRVFLDGSGGCLEPCSSS